MERWSYSFGRITIDGRSFTRDLIVMAEGGKILQILDNWWREEGHELRIPDIIEVFEFKPEELVVGTGSSGRMVVRDEVKRELSQLGIKLFEAETHLALQRFRELFERGTRVAGAFHLTC